MNSRLLEVRKFFFGYPVEPKIPEFSKICFLNFHFLNSKTTGGKKKKKGDPGAIVTDRCAIAADDSGITPSECPGGVCGPRKSK